MPLVRRPLPFLRAVRRAGFLSLSATLLLGGCGPSGDGSPGTAGSTGSTGSAGTSGGAGTTGSAGTSGTAGTTGTGGSVSTAGTGGARDGDSAGTTGSAGTGRHRPRRHGRRRAPAAAAGRPAPVAAARGRGGTRRRGGPRRRRGPAAAGGAAGTGGGGGPTGSGGTGRRRHLPGDRRLHDGLADRQGSRRHRPDGGHRLQELPRQHAPDHQHTYGGAGYALAFTWFGALRVLEARSATRPTTCTSSRSSSRTRPAR